MTLTQKRAKLRQIETEMSFWECVERDYKWSKACSRNKPMGVPLDCNNPVRQAIQALLEAHVRSQKERLREVFENACRLDIDEQEATAQVPTADFGPVSEMNPAFKGANV